MSFTTAPSLGSLLKCYAVPEVGGDTLFANMYLAYDALSAGMKKLIDGLHGIHLSGTRKLANSTTGVVRAEEQKRINPPVAQPVVRAHPETGRKALYIGEKVRRFDGMTEEESAPLIDYLVRHATRPEFVYRHQWRKHDILAWDNRCVMHQALGDFDETQLRHMERTTVLGTPSGYVVA
jgi:taurine dioxygenase